MTRRKLVAAALAAVLVMVPLAAFAAYPDYDWVESWGSFGILQGQFNGPDGLAEGPNGEIYVTDSQNSRIQVFDPDGMELDMWGSPGVALGQLSLPAGICVGPDGRVYVADAGNNRVQVFDAKGNALATLGTPGSANGQFEFPVDVEIGPDGLLYVSDYDNHRVQVVTTAGVYVRKWGGFGAAVGQFNGPAGIGIDREGNVWVADSYNNRVQVFDRFGESLGTWSAAGPGDGEFNRPYDVCFDPHGYVYVTDMGNNRVQKFTPDGVFVTKFGTPGSGPGQLGFPFESVATRERYVLVSDGDNDRLQRWFTAVPAQHDAIAGSTRFETAVKASQEAYPTGLSEDREGFKTVLIATGRNWPDALGGSSLAGVLDAPILLVEPNALPTAVGTEITRLGATRAIILGATAAVSDSVADAIEDLPGAIQVDRIGGVDRYETAELIADEVVDLQGVDFEMMALVATGANFPDALAVSPIAAAHGWPLYLADPRGIRQSTLAAIQSDNIMMARILGGPNAVSAETEAAVKGILTAAAVERIQGDDRYETAVELAWYGQAEAGMNWTYPALATGKNFPDALTGGPMQARDRSIMLLTRGDAPLETVVGDAIEDHKNAIWTMRYLGGTSAVAQTVRDEVANLLY